MQPKFWTQKLLAILYVSVCWASCGLAHGAEKQPETGAPAFGSPKKLPYTISPATTLITQPFTEDGRLDFAAALNAELSAGVTPDNNGVVVLMQLLPPRMRPTEQTFYKALGIEIPPEQGPFLQLSDDFLAELLKKRGLDPKSAQFSDEQEKLSQQFDVATSRPWRDQEFPLVAEWLKQQLPVLDQLKKLERRDRWFVPYSIKPAEKVGGGYIQAARFEHEQTAGLRMVGDIIATWAMRELGEGRYDQALQVIRHGLRLAELSQGGAAFGVELLVASSVRQRMVDQPLGYLIPRAAAAKLDLGDLERDFTRVLNVRPQRELLDRVERYSFLVEVLGKIDAGYNLLGMSLSEPPVARPVDQANADIELDLLLTELQRWTKKSQEIAWIESNEDRNAKFKKLKEELESTASGFRMLPPFGLETKRGEKGAPPKKAEPVKTKIDILKLDPRERTKALAALIMLRGMPGFPTSFLNHSMLNGKMQLINFALERYRQKEGKYPQELAELKAVGLDKLPLELDKKPR